MTSLKSNKVINGLQKKGFSRTNSDHAYLILYVDGRKTQVYTKVSFGSKEIGEFLIKKMSNQVRLNKKEFIDLVNCPMSFETYVEKLQKEGVLETPNSPTR